MTGTRRATIADVARQAGVSKAAVSFAFNNPERLSAETVERIRTIATGLEYRPNPVARMLTARQTTTIGILTPRPLGEVFGNPFFALFAEGVSEVTEDQGYGLLFISPLLGSIERALDRATVDGVVVVGLEEDHPEVEAIRRAGLPMVIVDAPAWEEHDTVLVDEEAGAAAAAAHLVELGHRDVLVIALGPGEPRRTTRQGVVGRRLAGYEATLLAAGISLPNDHLVSASATFESGEAAFHAAWRTGIRATAVLAMSDAIAIGVIGAARGLGLAVPSDLSVVGFDDLPVSRFTDPPLTTVNQPVREKGSEAARLLLGSVAGTPSSAGRHEVLPTHLVVRGSTAPPPDRSA